jgi:phage terminase large subunit-like protein
MITAVVDTDTKNWIRNASDDLAVANGCRFDGERAEFVVQWIERYCKLYEGDFAGQNFHLLPWQKDVVMRLFGWIRYSEKWGRHVRRFRRAGLWVPKKNGKSPLLAAIGLYLLCGDGEQGQKVYSSAKDGKQAMIAHTHAMEMVRRSPELMAECSINKQNGQITHEPSRSFYRVVSGDNLNSQEGLNGSVMVDETHVVDSRLMRILRGAGISRSEPLQLEVSTAGKNPDGYGKQQWDYGESVISGAQKDHQFFYAAFGADQKVSDDTLDENLLEIGKQANPSWGRTIDPEEFAAEYQTSRRSLADLADFKMYRLNIWQRSASPFIRGTDWSACYQDFDEREMAGHTCALSIDLSKTRDMTCVSAVFPWEGDRFRILSKFWLPREIVEANAHLAPFKEWEASGHLEVTDDNIIDYGPVERQMLEWCQLFNVRSMVYDPAFANEMTQRVSDATGVERFMFPQKPAVVGPAVDEFERAVLAHKFHHNGHPIMSWQIGHVQVKSNPVTKLRMLIKPDGKDSIRKIDGVITAVMGVGFLQLNPVIDWYTPGGLAL